MKGCWRDVKAWNDFGVPLSTASNEAAKLFDGVLTQYVGWYDDTVLGGLMKSCEDLIKSDPNFVMGRVIVNGLDVLGTGRTTRLDPSFDQEIKDMLKMTETQQVSPREKKHALAVKLWADGEMTQATNTWEDILLENPKDMLALKFAHDSYFYQGHYPQMRDSIARVMPVWNQSMPLYSYLHGMYAFGLEECNLYRPAEEHARKGLELNKNDAWSTHALAHVLEMEGRQNEGISFLKETETNWNICGMIACHNYWHFAVYHTEKGNYEEALGIFDSEVSKRAKDSGAMLDFVDAASLLYRLQMEGVNVKDRWQDVYEICKDHLDDHVLSFNDAHMMMSCLGANQKQAADKLLNSMKEYVKNVCGENQRIMAEVGIPLCEAILAFEEGDYAKAVNIAYPLRYRIISIGGSHAQRDVFSQFIIQAALNSKAEEHCKLARFLLTERKALKESAPLTDRLISKAMAIHGQ